MHNISNIMAFQAVISNKYPTTPTYKYLRKTLVFMWIAHYGKSSITIFKESFASIDKKFFWKEDWALGYNSMKF